MITLKEISRQKLADAQQLLVTVPNGAKTAASNALNRAAMAGRVVAVKRAREEYYVSAAEVRKTININKASRNRLVASIEAVDTRRELIRFKTLPNTITRGRQVAEVQVMVKKSEGAKPLPGAFIEIGTSSGQMHVLKREGADQYPIHIKYGPSVPQMIGAENVRLEIENRAYEVLANRLDHEIDRLLSK